MNPAQDTDETIRAASLRSIERSEKVFEDIRSGALSLQEAQELNNALGKTNGAVGNLIKLEVLQIARVNSASAIENRFVKSIEELKE